LITFDTLAESWESFTKEVPDLIMGRLTRERAQLIFYTGATVMFGLMHKAMHQALELDDGHLDQLLTELEQWANSADRRIEDLRRQRLDNREIN
jgi:hypothetical protein